MLSPVMATTQYEIWLRVIDEGFKMPVQALGVYESSAEAGRVASRLQDWIALGIWPAEFDLLLGADDLDDLYHLRAALVRGFQLDLADVIATVRPFPAAGGDNAEPTVEHWRGDAGHVPASPKTVSVPIDTYYMLGDADETEGE